MDFKNQELKWTFPKLDLSGTEALQASLMYEALLISPAPLTRLELCQAIDRKKSPHLLALIERLREAGYIQRTAGETANNLKAFYYSVEREN